MAKDLPIGAYSGNIEYRLNLIEKELERLTEIARLHSLILERMKGEVSGETR